MYPNEQYHRRFPGPKRQNNGLPETTLRASAITCEGYIWRESIHPNFVPPIHAGSSNPNRFLRAWDEGVA